MSDDTPAAVARPRSGVTPEPLIEDLSNRVDVLDRALARHHRQSGHAGEIETCMYESCLTWRNLRDDIGSINIQDETAGVSRPALEGLHRYTNNGVKLHHGETWVKWADLQALLTGEKV